MPPGIGAEFGSARGGAGGVWKLVVRPVGTTGASCVGTFDEPLVPIDRAGDNGAWKFTLPAGMTGHVTTWGTGTSATQTESVACSLTAAETCSEGGFVAGLLDSASAP